MAQGTEPFPTCEQFLSLEDGGHGITLPNDGSAEKGEKENKGEKQAEWYKVPDHAYWVDETTYPCVVFETGWTQTMEDLEGMQGMACKDASIRSDGGS